VNDPRIRAATLDDADEIAHVHVQVWRETYRGVMPDAFLAGLSVEQCAAMWKRVIDESSGAPNLWVLENVDKAIIGFGCIGTSRDERLGSEGEVLAINLLDVVKRRSRPGIVCASSWIAQTKRVCLGRPLGADR
jgi:hypothetical protein